MTPSAEADGHKDLVCVCSTMDMHLDATQTWMNPHSRQKDRGSGGVLLVKSGVAQTRREQAQSIRA